MTTPETQGTSLDVGNTSSGRPDLSGPGVRQRNGAAPANEVVALDRASILFLLGAVVALLVLLIGYWIDHKHLVLAGGIGVCAMVLLWVLAAWVSLSGSLLRWLRSRHGRQDLR